MSPRRQTHAPLPQRENSATSPSLQTGNHTSITSWACTLFLLAADLNTAYLHWSPFLGRRGDKRATDIWGPSCPRARICHIEVLVACHLKAKSPEPAPRQNAQIDNQRRLCASHTAGTHSDETKEHRLLKPVGRGSAGTWAELGPQSISVAACRWRIEGL